MAGVREVLKRLAEIAAAAGQEDISPEIMEAGWDTARGAGMSPLEALGQLQDLLDRRRLAQLAGLSDEAALGLLSWQDVLDRTEGLQRAPVATGGQK